jgi:hypothetical protein
MKLIIKNEINFFVFLSHTFYRNKAKIIYLIHDFAN